MKEFKKNLAKAFGKKNLSESFDELTLVINSDDVIEVCTQLRDDFNFDILSFLNNIYLSLKVPFGVFLSPSFLLSVIPLLPMAHLSL